MAIGAGTLRRRFGALDGLRAIGALGVLCTHVGFESGDALRGPFRGLLSRLDAGVAIFFVISGFLLYRPHVVALVQAKARPAIRTYIWHRALRILPALWIAIALSAVLLSHTAEVNLASYLQHAALIHVYFENHQVAGLTQMWSLATEGAFYVVLPLLAWLLSRLGFSGRRDARRQLMVIGAFAVIGPAWMAVSAYTGHPSSALWLPGYLGWFGGGMSLAVWQVARSQGILPGGILAQLADHPGTVWAGAAAVFALATSPLAGPYDLSPPSPGQAATKNLLYLALALLIVFPAVAGRGESEEPRAVRALAGRVGHSLGDISYGVFAYHVVVLGVVQNLIGHVAFTGRFAPLFWLTLSLSMVLATLSYRLIERPIMRRGRRDRRIERRERRIDVSPLLDVNTGDVPSRNDTEDGPSRKDTVHARARANKVRH